LLSACEGNTPEAIELKALLEQNCRAAVGNGRPQYRWSPESTAMLVDEIGKGTAPKKIIGLINETFDRDFSAGAIYSKIDKLGLRGCFSRARV
jgi:hypothetical protein